MDLAAWQAWVDYPFEVRSGRGALQLWLGFADRALTELTASVALDDVVARFARDLPLLETRSMRGQFGAKKSSRFELIDLDGDADVVYEGFARQLALVPKGGAALAPADFTAQWRPAQGKAPAAKCSRARSSWGRSRTSVNTCRCPARRARRSSRPRRKAASAT